MPHTRQDTGGSGLIRLNFLVALILLAPLSGCLSQHRIADECVIQDGPEDGTLTIVTYNIFAITDEVLAQFTEQTGYEVEIISTDDAGGILENLLLTQEAPQAGDAGEEQAGNRYQAPQEALPDVRADARRAAAQVRDSDEREDADPAGARPPGAEGCEL